MKLLDIFEQESNSPLQPGEKRQRADITTRDLYAISNKLERLEQSLHDSEYLSDKFAKDAALQAALTKLQNRIKLKISYVEKIKQRPTMGETKIMDILERECSEWLTIVRKYRKFLYRGLRLDASVFEGRSSQDRKPQTGDQATVKKFDHALASAGFQALKSNSIATTTDYVMASNYGWNTFIIFPKNGYHLTTTNARELSLYDNKWLLDSGKLEDFAEELQEWLTANVENWNWTDLGYNLRYRYWSSLFSDIREEFDQLGNRYKLPNKFDVKMEDFMATDEGIIRKYEPTSTDIAHSMRNGNEILINGEYWAFNRKIWDNFLHKKIWPGGSY